MTQGRVSHVEGTARAKALRSARLACFSKSKEAGVLEGSEAEQATKPKGHPGVCGTAGHCKVCAFPRRDKGAHGGF